MNSKTNKSSQLLPVIYFSLLLTAFLTIIYFAPSPLSSLFKEDVKEMYLNNSTELEAFFQNKIDTLADISRDRIIPEFSTSNLPEDLESISPQKRTRLFITLVLPHAIRANEEIEKQRAKLLRYISDTQTGKYISENRKEWFNDLAYKYRVSPTDPKLLLDYVDIIPISLTLGQAITESGWGTSRFALQGNALYGQHLSKNSKGKYITSLYGGVKVAAFDSIDEATKSYMHNLNTSRAYSKLRNLRKSLRENKKEPDGYFLAQGLEHYSEIGNAYVRDIQYLIRKYKLQSLERVTFDKSQAPLKLRFSRDRSHSET